MNVPNYVNETVVDENGHFTPSWQLFFDQLINQLNTNLSDEGTVIPSQDSAAIGKLTDSQNGTLVYDETSDNLMVNIDGVFKTVTVT
jgi:hypothetical protein